MPRLKLYIEDDGVAQAQLDGIAARARDASPAMRKIQAMMLHASEEQFASKGSRGGYSWKEDSPATIARKIREGYPADTEVRTGDLHRGLTVPEGGEFAGEIRKVLRTSTAFGVLLHYAQFQGHARQLLAITELDANAWANVAIDYILSGE